MCDGPVISLEHHTLVALNGKKDNYQWSKVCHSTYPYDISGLLDQINQLCLVVTYCENKFLGRKFSCLKPIRTHEIWQNICRLLRNLTYIPENKGHDTVFVLASLLLISYYCKLDVF